MPLSNEVRRLERSWANDTAWPKRLEWIEINRLRGWSGQRIEFEFPIVAISGENGSGKSSIIQAAASVYRDQLGKYYASEFFPGTAWDTISDASIKFSAREGAARTESSIRKPTERWKGNAERPERPVLYFDLSRVLPVGGRVGYAKIAKSRHKEVPGKAVPFDQTRLDRLSYILNHKYAAARMALTDVDAERRVPVLQKKETGYSGYHQGQGETTVTELIQTDWPKYSLILIDEIESSLHPRAQRRLIRDLANVARERELQIILTTHSPYILEELPEKARMQIFWSEEDRKVMTGVSAQFAMSKMDDAPHPDCELYVEDEASKTLLGEILSLRSRDLAMRVQVFPFGAASVGYQLGHMVETKRFPRATAVFLDGDCKAAPGCHILPGNDAPERAVFGALRALAWRDVWTRVKRSTSDVSAACDAAMNLSNHHDWVAYAAKQLALTPGVLWHAMCGEWAERCVSDQEVKAIERYLEDRLLEYA